MASRRRNGAYLALIIFVAIAPSAVSLGWYAATGNPALRPLALTLQSLRSYTADGEIFELEVYVHWNPADTAGYSLDQVTRQVQRAFSAKGVEPRMIIRATEGPTYLLYEVGASRMGPYPVIRAAEGISPAVAAYRMKVPAGS